MLHVFLTANHSELIRRCREKVAKRFLPSLPAAVANHGVPLFLKQLSDTLRAEQITPNRGEDGPQPTPAPTRIGHAAALHGAELLRLGHTIDQVVHEYGDVCQAITQLAGEKKVSISTDEFRTLNRCLDSAIADAVASFSEGRKAAVAVSGREERAQLQTFLAEYARLVDVAMHAFGAIRTGNVGLRGSTGNLLYHFLEELHSLEERTWPKQAESSLVSRVK